MSVENVKSSNFDQEVLQNDKPVLVDFYADWCGPCKMLAPVIDEVATEYEGKVKIVKVNVDENQDLAGEYGVMSIPTLVFFKNGEAVDNVGGFMPKKQLTAKIEENI
ncbi:thioredoxin [Proteinivorax hydrogeniformans]|uniref:Thioredoxin n=1 Tax=Proteinivorax hydrogeniformans TaxID=1826727 RepID=A0AAU8HV64_9FIRM